jgi:thioredoxin reductase (NADPH)
LEPCTRWLGDSVALDPRGFVLTGESVANGWQLDREPLISETSMPGLFAAGDVCAGTVKRVGAAVGQGAMAMQAIASYLRGRLGRIPAQQRRTPGIRQFDLLDADGNGYVEEQDLAEVARRLVTGFGEPLDSERGRRVIAGYGELWHALVEIADDNGDNRISRDEFAAATAELTSSTPVFRLLAEAVVALCDTDDDGAMNEAEFEKVLAILGVPIEDVGAYYRELDADRSGYLDTNELTVALGQFYGGAELLAAARAAG